MPEVLHPTGVLVKYVIVDHGQPSGFVALGSYPTHVPPRRGEIVNLDISLGSGPQPFRVNEVIHHMPRLGPPPPPVYEVCCVVSHLHSAPSPSDLSRIIRGLISAADDTWPGEGTASL